MSSAHCSAAFVPPPAGRRSEDVYFSGAESEEEASFERCLCTAAPRKRPTQSALRRSFDAQEETKRPSGAARSSKSNPGKLPCAPKSSRDNTLRTRGSRERKAPDLRKSPEQDGKVISPERRNLSDAATPPRKSQEDDVGNSHKNWRLGETVVTVEPSGFSDVQDDEDDSGDDLFSDAFREKKFCELQSKSTKPDIVSSSNGDMHLAAKTRIGDASPSGHNARERSWKGAKFSAILKHSALGSPDSRDSPGPSKHADGRALREEAVEDDDEDSIQEKEPSKIFFSKLAERLAREKQQRTQAASNDEGSHGMSSVPSLEKSCVQGGSAEPASAEQNSSSRGPTGSNSQEGLVLSASPDRCALGRELPADVSADGMLRSGENPASFEYDLQGQDKDNGEESGSEKDCAQLDQGSQYHCYGDIAIEAMQSDGFDMTEDRIASSCPEEEMQDSSRPALSHIGSALQDNSQVANKTYRPKEVSGAQSSQPLSSAYDCNHARDVVTCGSRLMDKHASRQHMTNGRQVDSHFKSLHNMRPTHPLVMRNGEDSGSRHGVIPGTLSPLSSEDSRSEKQMSKGKAIASPCLRTHALSLPCEHGLGAKNAGDVVGPVGFQTAKGRMLQAKDESYAKAQAMLGGVLSELQAVPCFHQEEQSTTVSCKSEGSVASLCHGPITEGHPGSVISSKSGPTPEGARKANPLQAPSMDAMTLQSKWQLQDGNSKIGHEGQGQELLLQHVNPRPLETSAHPRGGLNNSFSYHLQDHSSDNVSPAGKFEGRVEQVAFQTGSGNSLAPSSDSLRIAASKFGDIFGELHAIQRESLVSDSFTNVAKRGGQVNYTHSSSKSGSGLSKKSSGVPFEYCLSHADAEPVIGFKCGAAGRPVLAKAHGKTSIFGSLLDDMAALGQKDGKCSQENSRLCDQVRAEARGPSHNGQDDSYDGGPVFTRGTGVVVQPSQESMRSAALKYGGRPIALCTPPIDSAGPIFSTGTGRVVNPSSESMVRAEDAYGDEGTSLRSMTFEKVDVSPENSEPIFTKGSGARVEPSAESLARAMASYGSRLEARTNDSRSNDKSARHSLVRGPTQDLDDSVESNTNSGRPLVPKFGNSAATSACETSTKPLATSTSGAKRASASSDGRRPFKVPRRLSTPTVPTPGSSTASAAIAGAQGMGTPLSAVRSFATREAFGFDTPSTPGVLMSEGKTVPGSTCGKALASPRHLFSPETARRISSFRIANQALMKCGGNGSVDTSISNTSVERSINVPGDCNTSAMSDDPGPGSSQKRLDDSASLSLPLQDAVQHAMPFEDCTNGNIEIKDYMKIREISQHNASCFKFACGPTQFFPLAQDAGGEDAQQQQTVGLEEMYAVLQARTHESDETQVGAPDIAWAENHYRWIVWKLASMERAFPSIFGGRWLTPDRVMLQLLDRFDKEVAGGARSVLLQIKQRDQVGSRHLILCVSGISFEGELVTLELMDGWNSVQAVASPHLAAYARQGKIFIGQKLRLYGSETTQEEGKEVSLKIGSNGVRRAEWYAKLGLQAAQPPKVSIRSVRPGEGVVPAVLVVLQRAFPVLYMETLPSGDKVWRSWQSEESAQAAALVAQQDAWDKFLTAKMNSEKLAEPETKEAADERHAMVEEWRREFLKSQGERKVSSAMTVKVICLSPNQQGAQAEAYVTFWRPQQDFIQGTAIEGKVLEIHNLSVSPFSRNDLMCLSQIKGTKCRAVDKLTMEEQELAQAMYSARSYIGVSEMHEAPARVELDVIGVVIAVSTVYSVSGFKGPRQKQSVVLTCPSASHADDEVYAVVHLDLTGLGTVKLLNEMAAKRQGPVVLAIKNLRDVSRVSPQTLCSLQIEAADCCNIFSLRAQEDAEIVNQAPPKRDGGCSSSGDGGLHEQWVQLTEWINNGGMGSEEAMRARAAETLDSCGEEEETPLQRRACRAMCILQSYVPAV